MKKIANILTLSKFDDNLLYNIVDKKENLIEGIPTLCIGIEMVRKNFSLFNIIDFKVDDLTYWTYGPREKRNRYESDLLKFSDLSVKKYIDSIKYEYVNVIVDGFNTDLFKRVKELIISNNHIVYLNNGMIYMYDDTLKKVYGLSIREIYYCGFDCKKFLSKLHENAIVLTNKDISADVKKMFSDNLYIMPSLF